MKTNELLKKISLENSLKLVETTTCRNGLPENVKLAIIGFSDFATAEKLATENNLSIELFKIKDGGKFYYSMGTAYEPLENTAEDFGEDCQIFSKLDSENFIENEISYFISEFETIAEMKNFLEDREEIFNKIKEASEDEIVVTNGGKYYETLDKYAMTLSVDNTTYAIGLI